MILYVYLIINTLLSFIIVGVFYGVFSIFLRAIFDSDDCINFTHPANLIENAYLVFLFLTLLLSTTTDIQWAETGFRLWSIFMGLFTVLMIVCSAFFLLDATFASVGVLFFAIYALSYAVPLVLNLWHLRVCDFIKGVLYSIYLSPTYINIFTIYSISNIHDVSWGSRPATQNETFAKIENKKMIMYRNFRSRFLIFWVAVNIIIGYGFLYLWREGFEDIIFYIGAFLVGLMFFRIILSTVYKFKARWDRLKTKWTKLTRNSKVFKNVGEFEPRDQREVFQVYFDSNDQNVRITNQNDPKAKLAQIRSSVKDQNVYRGFNLQEITYQHRISQGFTNILLNKSTIKFPRQSTRYVGEEIEESDEEDSSSIESPELPRDTVMPKKQIHTTNNDTNDGKKVNFKEEVKDM